MSLLRLFVAVPLTDELRDGLRTVQRELAALNADVRWTNPDSIHMTLNFLGDTDEARVPEIGRELAECSAGHGRHELVVQGLGAFPDLRRARVVWAGLSGALEQLSALQQELELRLEALGFPAEQRRFSPHLTLGRVRSGRGLPRLAEALTQGATRPIGRLPVEQLALYSSELLPAGARYTALARHGLA